MFVSSPDLVQDVAVKPGISDHDAVIADFTFQAAVGIKKPRKVYVYGKADKEQLKDGISQLKSKFLSEHKNRSVNSNWLSFTDSLRRLMDKCIPKKIIKSRQNLPWLDNKLRKKIRKKSK